jgi:hypothetical protein
MGEMTYAEVHTQLLGALPELQERYDNQASLLADRQGRPGQYLVIEFVLNPLLRETLGLDTDPALLTRIFEFLERMASSRNTEVANVLQVGIFENLVGYPDRFSAAWTYMGPET